MDTFKIAKGRMAVYSETHKLQEDKHYYTSMGMKLIMEQWIKEYPGGYYIQVRPYTSDLEKVKHKFEIVKAKVEIERPPAVYDNVKSLYEMG